MELTLQTIEKLIDLANDRKLSELTVENKDHKVVVKTAHAVQVSQVVAAPVQSTSLAAPVQQASAAAPAAPVAKPETSAAAPAESKADVFEVTSPMVGTYYAAPSPDSPNFVEVGKSISKGQTVCIIEAMKLMNELEADASGKVLRILVENGQPVEFGQVLMEIQL